MSDDTQELARMACYCGDCCGVGACRADGDCARESIVEAIDEAVAMAQKERMRSPEWWATYNAAIAGMLAADSADDMSPKAVHRWAVEHADMAVRGES